MLSDFKEEEIGELEVNARPGRRDTHARAHKRHARTARAHAIRCPFRNARCHTTLCHLAGSGSAMKVAPFRLRHDADQLELLLRSDELEIGTADAIRYFRLSPSTPHRSLASYAACDGPFRSHCRSCPLPLPSAKKAFPFASF
jgi:hypothetical protein